MLKCSSAREIRQKKAQRKTDWLNSNISYRNCKHVRHIQLETEKKKTKGKIHWKKKIFNNIFFSRMYLFSSVVWLFIIWTTTFSYNTMARCSACFFCSFQFFTILCTVLLCHVYLNERIPYSKHNEDVFTLNAIFLIFFVPLAMTLSYRFDSIFCWCSKPYAALVCSLLTSCSLSMRW